MERIDFYHLQKSTLDETLPKLVLKAYETKKNIKIKVGNELRTDFFKAGKQFGCWFCHSVKPTQTNL